MCSYVVKLDARDILPLLEQWHQFGCDVVALQPHEVAPAIKDFHPGIPTLVFRQDIVTDWASQWPRLRWLYFCDNAEGISLRLYDEEHFFRYAGRGFYIEADHRRSDNQDERVIVRGYDIGSEPDQQTAGLSMSRLLHEGYAGIQRIQHMPGCWADVDGLSLSGPLKLRMRAFSRWRIYPATAAPALVPVGAPPADPVNVQTPADDPGRLHRRRYFEHPTRNNMPPPIISDDVDEMA